MKISGTLSTAAFGVFAVAGLAIAQDKPDLIELNPFAGGSFPRGVQSGFGTQHAPGGALGIRVTENFWRYVGLEQSYTYSVNNLQFRDAVRPGLPTYGFGSRLHNIAMNGVLHFTPRGSTFRPFLTAGLGFGNFTPTTDAKDLAFSRSLQAIGATAPLKNDLLPVFNYGGGLKWHFARWVGLRFDARGNYSKNPTYGMPDSVVPGRAFIPRGDRLHALQLTGGVVFYFGRSGEAPAPRPAAPAKVEAKPEPPAPKPAEPLGVRIEGGDGVNMVGVPIDLRAVPQDPLNHRLRYDWTVDGASAGSGQTIRYTPSAAGAKNAQVRASSLDDASRTATASKTLQVQDCPPPTISSLTVNPPSINQGDAANARVEASAPACGGRLTYRWTAAEGSITGSDNTARFDSRTVRFDASARPQTKPVTITATVTDERGRSASRSVDVRVNYTPQAVRFADIVFPKGSARVNNCGKRILLEELQQRAADPDYEIVLVGHHAADEARGLDRRRVMNVAAVLAGGTGTCGNVDRSRIKVDWVGTEQTADFQPGLCGSSTRGEAKERKGQEATAADQTRRVEVWLVPKGTRMPASVKAPKEVNEKEMKVLGCPQ
jgi:outer membrane protein OmpA-like peptidoglycan-associated protein